MREERTTMEEILARQRAFFDTGITRPAEFRKKSLTRLEFAILRNRERLYKALKDDLGKSRTESYETEIGIVLAELRHARAHLERWAAPTRHLSPIALFPARSMVRREPYGVALIMAPWNYPVQLNLVPLISALAGGNCAVVKPSAYAPETSHALKALLDECFPPQYVAVVEGGRAENSALLEQKFDYIFFTGSIAVGKTVMHAAAEHLTPVTLELGGKSPCIVAPDANLELAAKRIIWGKLLNAGQTCVAPDHVYVTRPQRDALVSAMEKWANRFYGGNPFASPDYPHIVNRKHFDRLTGLLRSGTIAFGGQTDARRLQIAPTVLVDVRESDPVMGEEIFGPILPVLTYNNVDSLTEHLRQKEKPLALYVFTRSRETARRVVNRLPSGGVCINDTVVQLANPRIPFGGVGQSGMGACHGRAGFDTFTRERSVVARGALDLPVRYPPFNAVKDALLNKLL